MDKEIKEKCKECVYYNERMEYPKINGTTTHSNCMSIKCDYRKATKDLKIIRLNNKIADLEAKLAEEKNRNKKLNHEAQKYYEDAYCNGFQNQTAIAELEKVKKLLKHKGIVLRVKPPIELPTVPGNEYLHEFMIPECDFERIFDQQIKELKGESK